MKFYGTIGFWEDEIETRPGIYESVIVEKKGYTGDVLRNVRRFQTRDQTNDEFTTSNQISILADLYLMEHWSSIRYVIWNKVKWKVTSVDVNYPRVVLDLGGVWNGESSEGITKDFI